MPKRRQQRRWRPEPPEPPGQPGRPPPAYEARDVPGRFYLYEVTYVISGGGRSVYFAGDTLLIPELRTLTDRYGPLDVALLPVNGLHIRMAGNKQVVMNAEEAAELTAALRPKLAVPQHYAFTSGTMGDRIFLKSDKDPSLFVEAARRLAPDVPVKVISPGEPLTIAA